MRTRWCWALGLVLVLAIGLYLVRSHRPRQATPPIARTSVETNPSPVAPPQAAREVLNRKRADFTDAQLKAFRSAYTNRLRPAFDSWSKAYSGHLPFDPKHLTEETLFGEIGRGNYCMYTFIVDGVTLSIEDANGVVHVSYLSSPESKALMKLPAGAPPKPELPVPRSAIETMLQSDSGSTIPPADIRLIPTAFSSAMNGGVQVHVGGDPNNAASWKFTLVFGPEGKLNYYCRGHL